MRNLKKAIHCKTKSMLLARILLFSMMFSLTSVAFTQPASARSTYLITDGDAVIVHTTAATDIHDVIEEAGLSLKADDSYSASTLNGVAKITIHRMCTITVQCDGKTETVRLRDGSVRDVLENHGIELSANDRVSHSLDTEIADGMSIVVTRISYQTTSYDEVTPHETVYYEDTALESDARYVLTAGSDGLLRHTVRITYENDKETRRETLSTDTVKQPECALVLCSANATKEHRVAIDPKRAQALAEPATPALLTQMTAAAKSQNVEKVLSFKATAYSCDGRRGITASGSVARVGSVAVDPRVIPMGTKMFILSDDGCYVYGYCVAEDTGGAIKGNIVDLYMDTSAECWKFGRRAVTIYILD